MKILVTGGAGFIGSHLVDALLAKGHEVRIFDNVEEQVHHGQIPQYITEKAEFIRGDITKKDDIKKAIEGVEAVYHQAAAVGVGQSMYQIEKYVNVNTLGTAKLLDILVNTEHSVKKLIVASSMSIYGEGKYKCADCGFVYPGLRPESQLKNKEWEVKCPACGKLLKSVPTDEEKPLKSTSIYAISKKDQEEMSLVVGRAYDLPTVALRYFNVYGSRQSLSNPYTGVCALFSSRIKNKNPPIIYEDGKQTRDFVHVSDIVQANLLALEKSSANYNVYNVGSGDPTSILKIAEVLIELYGSNLTPEVTQRYRKGDIRHCYADISKIKKDLGYERKVNFKEGMKRLVEWGRREESKDMFDEATKELEDRKLVM
jgi:dTDP-L-rhamnose 4-epimerase